MGIVALVGPVVSVIIRQVQGPVVRPFDVDGLSVQCLGDSRGVRVVCDDEVVFAAKSAENEVNERANANGKQGREDERRDEVFCERSEVDVRSVAHEAGADESAS